MLPKPMMIGLGILGGILGWKIWDASKTPGERARVGDSVGVSLSSLPISWQAFDWTTSTLPSGNAWLRVVATAEPDRLVVVPGELRDDQLTGMDRVVITRSTVSELRPE